MQRPTSVQSVASVAENVARITTIVGIVVRPFSETALVKRGALRAQPVTTR